MNMSGSKPSKGEESLKGKDYDFSGNRTDFVSSAGASAVKEEVAEAAEAAGPGSSEDILQESLHGDSGAEEVVPARNDVEEATVVNAASAAGAASDHNDES